MEEGPREAAGKAVNRGETTWGAGPGRPGPARPPHPPKHQQPQALLVHGLRSRGTGAPPGHQRSATGLGRGGHWPRALAPAQLPQREALRWLQRPALITKGKPSRRSASEAGRRQASLAAAESRFQDPVGAEFQGRLSLLHKTALFCGSLGTKASPALCDPVDSSPPGPSFQGISRGRILKRVPVSSSGGCSRPRDVTHTSRTGRWRRFC